MLRCRAAAPAVGHCFGFVYRALTHPVSLHDHSSPKFVRSSFSPLPSPPWHSAYAPAKHCGIAHPLVADKVALPSSAGRVPFLDLLPPAVRALYARPTPALLRPVALAVEALYDCGPARVFADRREYVKLTGRLHALGMLALSAAPPICINGLFGVPKKHQQRLIVNAVRANFYFKLPPHVELPNPSHFVALQAPAGSRVFVAKADLSNFYHQLLMPEWLWEYFGLPMLSVDELRQMGIATTVPLYPRLCTLPMGFSHAVLIARVAARGRRS